MPTRTRTGTPPPGGLALTVLGFALALVGGELWAQAKPPASSAAIYTCTDDRGRKITSDRPIVDCTSREQRILNSDGSLKSVRPPTLTADEQAEKEARDRKQAEARAAQADAVRRDRNLTQRYKTEAAHNKAREAAIDSVRLAIKATEMRLADLVRERKPLLDEAEFYKGKALPARLKTQIDANDAAMEAQRSASNTQQAELERINRLYDAELDRLKHLWSGAAPGSLGALPVKR